LQSLARGEAHCRSVEPYNDLAGSVLAAASDEFDGAFGSGLGLVERVSFRDPISQEDQTP
jgi:hypothetical protein